MQPYRSSSFLTISELSCSNIKAVDWKTDEDVGVEKSWLSLEKEHTYYPLNVKTTIEMSHGPNNLITSSENG